MNGAPPMASTAIESLDPSGKSNGCGPRWRAAVVPPRCRAISAARLRLLLGSIDAQLRSENPNEPTAIINYDDLQIEHVMPQSWTEHWPLPDDDDPAGEPSTQAAERSRAIDRIGNLTLVTPTFNRGVSNLAWSVKRKEFKNQRSLVLNYEIEQSETWDEASILERAKELSAAACRVWPSAASLGRGD